MNYESFYNSTEDRADISDEQLVQRIIGWRNSQLAYSDWTQLSDSPLANKAEWATYRQELRDITKQGPDPKVWVFPERP